MAAKAASSSRIRRTMMEEARESLVHLLGPTEVERVWGSASDDRIAWNQHSTHNAQYFAAEDHPKVQDKPLVSEEGIHSYAGVPPRFSKGQALGSFRGIGDRAHSCSDLDVQVLQRWAQQVAARLEDRRGRAS